MDVITLSSSDDDSSTSDKQPRKRIKLQTLPSKTICLDSSEDEPPESLPVAKENGFIKCDSTAECEPTKLVLEEVGNSVQESARIPLESTEPKTDSVDIIEEKLMRFFDKCLKTVTRPDHKELFSQVVPKVKAYYDKLKQLNCNLKDFECVLDRDTNVEFDGPTASSRFDQIFQFLKGKINDSENEIVIQGPKKQHLKKLEKTLSLVNRKIAKLDSTEVNFDDEENSHYLQAAKYKARATKIFRKICEIRKEDPNIDRPLYTKINFTKSKFPEFNRVINKRFRHFLQFPTYYDMDRCLRKCVSDKGMHVREEELKSEIKFCFEKLGLCMKHKRSLDLYDSHSDFIAGTEDPAQSNEEISYKLRENYRTGSKRMEEVLEKYTRMQESGVNPNVSSDSDDSNIDSN